MSSIGHPKARSAKLIAAPFFRFAASTIALALSAACAHRSTDREPLPTSLGKTTQLSVSPDGKWAVVSSRAGNTNPQLWFGMVERKSGRPVFAMSERDPRDPESFEGTVEATAWSPDSQFVACQLRKAHNVDDFVVAKHSRGDWQSVLLPPAFVLEEQYAKLAEVRDHYTRQTGGDWIESLRWVGPRTLRLSFDTTLDIDGPSHEARPFRFSAGADCTFTSSRPQVRWSHGSLSPSR